MHSLYFSVCILAKTQ